MVLNLQFKRSPGLAVWVWLGHIIQDICQDICQAIPGCISGYNWPPG